jgi:hypothetical protein
VDEYIFKRQTLAQVGARYDRSAKWAQRHIANELLQKQPSVERSMGDVLVDRAITAAADCTFFTRSYGILVIKDIQTNDYIYSKEITSESPRHYKEARECLASQGITIVGIVLDGRKGVREVFSDIPVQMCHFHQVQIITRYLTSRPKLEAGRELRVIAHTLKTTTETLFREHLALWYEKHESFINEKTQTGTITKKGKQRWVYTHRRLRSAYRSLMRNIDYLFIYKTHPELSLPNTTNTLDGSFSHLKGLLRVHRGMSKGKRWRLIQEILSKKR